MFKVQTLNAIAPIGLKQFPQELYEIADEIPDPDAIVVRSHAMHDMTFAPSLKVVGRAGAGVNNIPVNLLTTLGIPVLNTPGANANAVRELVIAGMLLASRNICQAWDYVKRLENNNETNLDQKIEQDKKQFVGFELLGKTLGVIGLGSVGVKVANAAMSLGMRIIGYDPTISVNRAWELSSEVKQASSLEHLLMEADFISLHVPLTGDTKNMLTHSQINLMKTGVVLLNFSRDGIIDNVALANAINERKVFAYVSDFPTRELKNSSHVICLPHLGASTQQAEENCAVMISKQIRDFLEFGAITNSINFPTIEMPPTNSVLRLAIVNANIPNMVAQISTKLAEAKMNIVSLLNKSQDKIAYTLIDINADLPDSLLTEISEIEGVVHVRKISLLK
ncbi:MAG: phosphoglycerate dehydrogenase [Gammaproteobacteria bacterium]